MPEPVAVLRAGEPPPSDVAGRIGPVDRGEPGRGRRRAAAAGEPVRARAKTAATS